LKKSVGIVGCGFIGGALKCWLEKYNPSCNVLISDPPKGYDDNLSNCDVIFISIHIKTEDNNIQNLSLLKNILVKLPNVPIYVRTTILPGTTDLLRQELKKEIYFMPEFLTERSAFEDFCQQPMIFTGNVGLLEKIFLGKKFLVMTSLEAEIAKYSHNVFGAVKVTYFNGIYELSKKLGCDYENIRSGVLLSGYINSEHTKVPGPDGKTGYGGKCFPKDVKSFMDFVLPSNLGHLIKMVDYHNTFYRNDDV
jgi:UDP-glucose 6-dehydrogenase